jgi:hypothetical protein
VLGYREKMKKSKKKPHHHGGGGDKDKKADKGAVVVSPKVAENDVKSFKHEEKKR